MRAAGLAVLLACAAFPALPRALQRGPELAADLPASVPQGGLVRGRLPTGSRLALLSTDGLSGPGAATVPGSALPVRVAADGRFVLGVGRDQNTPIQLRLTLADGSQRTLSIPVTRREWRIERIEGVPESTVNPPPAIAERIAREQAEVAQARLRDDDREDFAAVFTVPVRGRVSGVYGSQRVYNGTPKSPHSGLDVAAAKGTPVHAPAAGVISFAKPDLYLTGGTVLIDHGHGLSSNFLHLSRLDVKVGERAEQGQVIGLVGATGRATGPHMHWGMNWFGVRVDPQLLLSPGALPAP
jgi:hypothetical protein